MEVLSAAAAIADALHTAQRACSRQQVAPSHQTIQSQQSQQPSLSLPSLSDLGLLGPSDRQHITTVTVTPTPTPAPLPHSAMPAITPPLLSSPSSSSSSSCSSSTSPAPEDPFMESRKRRPSCVDKSTLYCHECGRCNTPEWRKGPDGPATLCNACGLQYAKKMRTAKDAVNKQLQTQKQPLVSPASVHPMASFAQFLVHKAPQRAEEIAAQAFSLLSAEKPRPAFDSFKIVKNEPSTPNQAQQAAPQSHRAINFSILSKLLKQQPLEQTKSKKWEQYVPAAMMGAKKTSFSPALPMCSVSPAVQKSEFSSFVPQTRTYIFTQSSK
eukprot:TRINITY_DN22895_c0_g1_i1.p1 TRINITY_DN22895_c0_g1~~TRINITY_DN22895_c0_g1_i1.p1  ORF type:complete len:326 (-),score=47.06 TRINITY_DN22895_c0_g1_i1:79-1056(-)